MYVISKYLILNNLNQATHTRKVNNGNDVRHYEFNAETLEPLSNAILSDRLEVLKFCFYFIENI